MKWKEKKIVIQIKAFLHKISRSVSLWGSAPNRGSERRTEWYPIWQFLTIVQENIRISVTSSPRKVLLKSFPLWNDVPRIRRRVSNRRENASISISQSYRSHMCNCNMWNDFISFNHLLLSIVHIIILNCNRIFFLFEVVYPAQTQFQSNVFILSWIPFDHSNYHQKFEKYVNS